MRAKEQSQPNPAAAGPPLQLVSTVVRACAETKARDITVLEVSRVFSLSDYFVIASGRSDRQVQGITNTILAGLQAAGTDPFSVEGMPRAHWVLIDCGAVVVHVFYEPLRLYYDLESLWHAARRIDIAKEIEPLVPGRQAA